MSSQTSNLPEGWSKHDLSDVCENISRRFDFPKHENVVFINTGDVLEGKFLHNKTVPKKGLPGQAKKAIKKGDILYSEIRPKNKRYALVNFEANNYVVSTKFMVLKKNEKIDLDFLYIFLTSNKIIQLFNSTAESRSGTFPQITFDAIKHINFNLPSMPEQKAIASILSSFDDKIELLKQQNETLEKIAQTIFNEWFGKYQVGDELPEGWDRYFFKDLVVQIKPGTNYQPKRLESGIPFVNGRNVKNGFINLSGVKYISKNEYSRVHKSWIPEENDILITRIGTLGNVGIIRKEQLPLAVHYNSIVIKEGVLPHQFIYFLLKSNYFQEKYHLNKKQAVQEFITIEEVENIQINFPKNRNEFSIFNYYFKKVVNNYSQIQKLSKTRDVLLPKLMSGKIRVKYE